MASVVVTIAGRTYRMACDDGEEPRLEELARLVEGKILAMRESFGDIGEQRIVVMAAIAIADEAHEMRRKFDALQAETAALRAKVEAETAALRAEAEIRTAGLRAEAGDARAATAELEARLAKALETAAERIDRMAAELSRPEEAAGGLF